MGATNCRFQASPATTVRNATILFFILVPVSLLLEISSEAPPVFSGLLFISGCVSTYVTYRYKKFREYARDGFYYLTEDVCANKRKYKDEYDDVSVTYTPYLIFRKNGNLILKFPYLSYAPYNIDEIYEQANAGDKFYLLWTNKHKVFYVFNGRHWELDTSEFTEENGIYIPKED